MIQVNGKQYKGNNVSVINGEVFIDGKKADQDDEAKKVTIVVHGPLETLDVDTCESVTVLSDTGTVTSKNGNVTITGNVTGDVINKNGNIQCGNVGGDVETKNGNIQHS